MPGSVLQDGCGLEVLVEGIKPSIDVVAIHTSDERSDAWTLQGATWLSDESMLPAVLPDARIMKLDHAAPDLEACTKAFKKKRPLIVLAHSCVAILQIIKNADVATVVLLGAAFDNPEIIQLRAALESIPLVCVHQAGKYISDSEFLDLAEALQRMAEEAGKVKSKHRPSVSFSVDPKVEIKARSRQASVSGRRPSAQVLQTNYVDPRVRSEAISAALSAARSPPLSVFGTKASPTAGLLGGSPPTAVKLDSPSKGPHRVDSFIGYFGPQSGSPSAETFGYLSKSSQSAMSNAIHSGRSSSRNSPLATPVPSRPTSPNRWDDPTWLDAKLCGRLLRWNATASLEELLVADAEFKPTPFDVSIRYRSTPFNEDRHYTWHYARVANTTIPYTIKMARSNFSRGEDQLEMLRVWHLSKVLALEFNKRTGAMLDIRSHHLFQADGRRFMLQPVLDDVVDGGQLCQAFSHFSYEVSKGQLLLSGLRGRDLTLELPIVHGKRFAGGLAGASFRFFQQHVCGDYCKRIHGQKRDVRVCNNKLCRRFCQQAVDMKVDGVRYVFCMACAPQMEMSKRRQCRCGRVECKFWYAARGLPVQECVDCR